MAGPIQQQAAQQIVEAVKAVCDRDVNFIDGEGRIFASTNPSRLGTFHELGREAFRSGQAMEVETDDRFLGTQKGVNLPFSYHGRVAAVIGISGPPAEVRRYAYLAQRITEMVLWEHDAGVRLRREEERLRYVIRALISSESVDSDFLRDCLASLQVDPEQRYRTVLFQLNTRNSLTGLPVIESRIEQAARQTGSPLYSFQYPNEYVLILEDGAYQRQASLFQALAGEQAGLRVGIGAAERLFRQSLSYRSAKLAIRSLPEGQRIALFDALDLELLLASISGETRTHFLEKTVRSLSDRERALLSMYFSCEMSLKRTSDRLFLHKNTLQYQLDKIGRKTGYDPRRFQSAVILYLGLKLDQL